MLLEEDVRKRHDAYSLLCCLLIFFSFPNVVQSAEATSLIPLNVTDILLTDYDNTLRPNFGIENAPVYVDVNLVIGSMDKISEVNMDYTMTIYLRQFWNDNRLHYNWDRVDVLPVDGRLTERLWLPDTYFTNDKDSYLQAITVKNRMLRIYPDGNIIYGLRLSITASCVFELKKFPHDRQNCSLHLESYGYNTKNIRLRWKKDEDSVAGDDGRSCVEDFDKVELPQFRITNWICLNNTVSFSSGDYDRLRLSFTLKRSVGYFVFQTYMPCIMVVCMSWVSFWINYESSPARVALGITTVLTMTTIFTSARSSLPRFSYVKAIDIYLLTCFVFVFASLLEYAIVNFNFWKLKHNKTRISKQRQLEWERKLSCSVTTSNTTGAESLSSPWIQHSALTSKSSTERDEEASSMLHQNYTYSKTKKEVLSTDELVALRLSTQSVNRLPNNSSPELPRRMASTRSDSRSQGLNRSSGCDDFCQQQYPLGADFRKGYIHALRFGESHQRGGSRSGSERYRVPQTPPVSSHQYQSASNLNDIWQTGVHQRRTTGSLHGGAGFTANGKKRSSSQYSHLLNRSGIRHGGNNQTYTTHFEDDPSSLTGPTNSQDPLGRRLVKLRSNTRDLNFPTGEQVIIIDRYSRIFFPTVFILFNAIYWWYYVL